MSNTSLISTRNPARILMIEDNPADVSLLRYALDQQDDIYSLDVLRDGAEAIEFIRSQRSHNSSIDPCVMTLDLHLPKHDGTAVLRAIAETPSLSNLRVVVLTNLASPQEEREALGFDIRLYRVKPAELDGWVSLAAEILAICKESALVPEI